MQQTFILVLFVRISLNQYDIHQITLSQNCSLCFCICKLLVLSCKGSKYEPVREKTNNLGFRPGPTQTGLYSHRKWLEAGNFGFRKKRDCTIHVAKTKALISFAVTAKLICGFVFAYANCCTGSLLLYFASDKLVCH